MTTDRSYPKFFAVAAWAALLTACGGGGDDAPPAAPAQGAYAGSITAGAAKAFELVVLEDGSYWALYGTTVANTLYVSGFVQGSGTSSNGSFSSTDTRDFGYAPAVAGSITATYVAGTSIAGTITATGGGSATFSGTTAAIAPYDYNAAAKLSDITGAWNLTMLTGETANVSITAAGALAGVSSGGCQFSGTVAPRPSGKNVFNVSLSFGTSPCLLAGQVASGIGVYSPTTAGSNQLIVGVVDSTRSYGTAAFGQR